MTVDQETLRPEKRLLPIVTRAQGARADRADHCMPAAAHAGHPARVVHSFMDESPPRRNIL